MKYKGLGCVLSLGLLLGLLSGCGAEEALDTAEDRLENNLEAAGEQVKGKLSTGKDQVESLLTSAFSGEATEAVNESSSMISKEEAQRIALEYVDLTVREVQGLHTKYEIDDGVPQYDVEFYKGATEYEFEIHAESGRILSFDQDR